MLIAAFAPTQIALAEAAQFPPETYFAATVQHVVAYAEFFKYFGELRDEVCAARSDKTYGRRTPAQREKCRTDYDAAIKLQSEAIAASIEGMFAKKYNDPREADIVAKTTQASDAASALMDQVGCIHLGAKDKCKTPAKKP